MGKAADWRRALSLAAECGAHPVFGEALRRAALELLPVALLDALRPFELLTRHRHGSLRQRLDEAMQLLSRAGIPVVLLKGAALGLTTYGAFSERPMRDVDVLVHPDRAREAHALLAAHGWTSRFEESYDHWYESNHHHLAPLLDARAPKLGVGLEIHVELAQSAHRFFALSAADVWRDAQPAPGMPVGVLVPSAEHRLLHCCIHFAWSHRMQDGGWRTFLDIAAMRRAGELTTERVKTIARVAGAQAPIYWSLRLARDVGRVDVADELLASLAPRWPSLVLRRFARHFAQEMLSAERLCPSARFRRMLWTLALRPRELKREMLEWDEWHGPANPESADDTGEQAIERSGRLAAWRKYLASVA